MLCRIKHKYNICLIKNKIIICRIKHNLHESLAKVRAGWDFDGRDQWPPTHSVPDERQRADIPRHGNAAGSKRPSTAAAYRQSQPPAMAHLPLVQLPARIQPHPSAYAARRWQQLRKPHCPALNGKDARQAMPGASSFHLRMPRQLFSCALRLPLPISRGAHVSATG